MLTRIAQKLDAQGIEDYEISGRIPDDVISITSDLVNPKIYIPIDLEYTQYDIDGFLRDNFGSHLRTITKLDRDIYIMNVSGRLTENQYYELVKYIIQENEFIVLLDK
jgi:hypothetical protein